MFNYNQENILNFNVYKKFRYRIHLHSLRFSLSFLTPMKKVIKKIYSQTCIFLIEINEYYVSRKDFHFCYFKSIYTILLRKNIALYCHAKRKTGRRSSSICTSCIPGFNNACQTHLKSNKIRR